MCDSMRFVDGDAPLPAALRQLVAEPALAETGLRDDAEHLAFAADDAVERRRETRQLGLASDKAREASRPGDLQPGARCAAAGQLVHLRGVRTPLISSSPLSRSSK